MRCLLVIRERVDESMGVFVFGGETSPDDIVTVGHSFYTITRYVGMRFIGC